MAPCMNIGGISQLYLSHYEPVSKLSNDELYKNCRFTEEEVIRMTDLMKDDFILIENNRGRPASPQIAMLIMLKYLAFG